MHILRIEYPVPDYDAWKAASCASPKLRKARDSRSPCPA